MPSRRSPWSRLHGFYQRKVASLVFKKSFAIGPKWPLISFTFDDFPRSALFVGGDILNEFGLAGTYYAALGLAGTETPTGPAFFPDDLRIVLERGHELGCHTFSHCHSWQTDPWTFEKSIIENQAALRQLIPEAEFKTFSYPISPPRPLTKAKIAGRFLCCRAGGQTFNIGTADLNQLSAYFLEKNRHDVASVRDVIDRNRQARGWLIFATHDISGEPTPYGCTPEFFRDVVQYAVNSGARIAPVARALDMLGTC
jgi:peptidoglycan/xylan/chitin deacetylase (PgdA/CDA1 family)